MHGVLALVVAEAQEDPQCGERLDHIDVLAPSLMGRNRDTDTLDDLLQDPPFFEVNVDGVAPTIVDIGQFPDLITTLGYLRPGNVHIEELAIDCPHALVALEDPAPHRCGVDFRLCNHRQRPQRGRHPAQILGRRVAIDDDLQHPVARVLDVLGSAGLHLTHPVDQVQLGPDRVLREIDHYVRALGHPQRHVGLVEQRCREQISVVGDVSELLQHVGR
ncbi:hypothetical protein D9M69_399470 [compost metagenome]